MAELEVGGGGGWAQQARTPYNGIDYVFLIPFCIRLHQNKIAWESMKKHTYIYRASQALKRALDPSGKGLRTSCVMCLHNQLRPLTMKILDPPLLFLCFMFRCSWRIALPNGVSMRSMQHVPSVSHHAAAFNAKSIEGINSCRIPIYYTWVERGNYGQNALSRGIRTEWDSNPRPTDYESTARTDTP